MTTERSASKKPIRWRSRGAVLAAATAGLGLAMVPAWGASAAAAAAASPSITWTTANGSMSGTGFTPGGQVLIQEDLGSPVTGSTVMFSTNVTASQTRTTLVCKPAPQPFCTHVTIPGGGFTTTVPNPPGNPCTSTGDAYLVATDRATGSTAYAFYQCMQ